LDTTATVIVPELLLLLPPLALVLLRGYRIWPAIVVGAFFSTVVGDGALSEARVRVDRSISARRWVSPCSSA